MSKNTNRTEEINLETVKLPTPAADALAEHESNLSQRKADEREAKVAELMALTATEVRERFDEAKLYMRTAVKPGTKAANVSVLANIALRDSETAKALSALRRTAQLEEEVIEAIHGITRQVANARAAVADSVAEANDGWGADRMLGKVAELQGTLAVHGLWYTVAARSARQGTAPLTALADVIGYTSDQMLSPHNNRVLSRSTSALVNLAEDIAREAKAGWVTHWKDRLKGNM